MWFRTEKQRVEFERVLSRDAGLDIEVVLELRAELASLPAGQLVNVWFGNREFSDKSGVGNKLFILKKHLPTRAGLFSWVYGPGASIARDLLYARIPSSEKRRLVSLILAASRNRFPWLNSRLIHAMAYRPRAFSNKSPQNRDVESWGPLYQRARIPKGHNKRYLWIPNPPLKRIQKSLLHLVGPMLERRLLPCVYGASSRHKAPVFQNAVAHVGKSFIATFDVQNFFPSTSINDVLSGIRYLNAKSSIMVDPSLLPHYLASSEQAKQLAWTHDAEILVARLATFRGRLPQGSPLSPLLANVAFAPFDTAIIEALKHEFGRDGVRYTRYCDDLTISVSRTAAGNRQLSAPGDVKRRCEALLEDVLASSHYRLQHRKSHCSPVSVGHNVTGLVVYRDRVELPRRVKRHLRSVVHHLQTGDFVSIARKWYAARGLMEPSFHTIKLGHRWQRVGLKQRRISAERIAALMLRHIYPDLKLERLLPDWYPWQEVFDRDDTFIEGRTVWAMIEWLLAALWSGEVTTVAGENEIRFRQAGVDICKVLAESALDFFYLPKEWAIAVVEYWHHLRGLSGYLRACPAGNEFDAIHQLRTQLDDAMHDIRIEAVSTTSQVAGVEEGAEPDTLGGRIKELSKHVFDDYEDFAGRIKCLRDGDLGSIQQRFYNAVLDRETFTGWICVVADLFVRRLPKLPIVPAAKELVSSEQLFDYVRVKDDQKRQRIHPHYKVSKLVEESISLKQTDQSYRNAQFKVLQLLDRYFDATTERRRALEASPPKTWFNELIENPWCEPLESQLTKQVDSLEELHAKLRSTHPEKRLYVKTGGTQFTTARELLTSVSERETSDNCWENLLRFCKTLYKTLYEEIEPELCDETPENGETTNPADWKRRKVWKKMQAMASKDVKKRLDLVEKMRHREAHGETADRRKDWVWIQRRVRDILGRSWDSKTGPKHPEFRADDDLELYGYEVGIVKLLLVRDAVMWLETLRDKWAWTAA